MKDFFGQELAAGDKVAFLKPGTSSSWLVHGVVSSFTPQRVMVAYRGSGEVVRRDPQSVVKAPC